MTGRTVALVFAGFAAFQAGRVVAVQAPPSKPGSNATDAKKPTPPASPAPTAKPGGPAVLEGVVKDPAQKSVEGARVLAWRLSRLYDPPVSTRTDASGRFHLSLTGRGVASPQSDPRGVAELAVPKGQVELAGSKDPLSGKATVTVREGETVAVEIKLIDSGAPPR